MGGLSDRGRPEARLDGAPVWTGWRLPMKAGQRLVLKRPQHGMRSYLAVAGGIDVPPVMGHALPISTWGLAESKAVY